MNILQLVQADAERRLAAKLKSRQSSGIASAIQEIVEATLPDPGMPRTRVRRAHPVARGRPHRVWRWVTSDGLANLVCQALDDWKSIEVSAHVTFPGVTARTELVYRDVTSDPKHIGTLVDAAVRQLRYRAG
jgi:hypothetical protein